MAMRMRRQGRVTDVPAVLRSELLLSAGLRISPVMQRVRSLLRSC